MIFLFKKLFNYFPLLVYTFLFLISFSCQREINQKENSTVQSIDSTIIQKHGKLYIEGNKILDKNNNPICFAGNSFFWSNNNWGGEKYYTPEVVSWLESDWNTTIVRASMGVEDPGGYLDDRTSNKNRIKTYTN